MTKTNQDRDRERIARLKARRPAVAIGESLHADGPLVRRINGVDYEVVWDGS